nr:DUF1446 domain-containing protein [Halalkalibacter krulwichiae]
MGGRTYDPAIFAAYAIKSGFDPALSWHLGKILECGALCLTPGTAGDCAFGVLRHDHFEVQSLHPERMVTESSVAAHVLYEKSHPTTHYGPGFKLDVSNCQYQQLNDFSVRVSGTKIKQEPYKVKLEGVEPVGWRHIAIAGVRDPIAISQIDHMINYAKERVKEFFSKEDISYELNIIRYGLDGVLGENEPKRDSTPHEIGLVLDVVSTSKEYSKAICSFARSTLLHYHYPGRKATAGNLAIPFPDVSGGEVFEFTIYHLMEVEDPCELFPLTISNLGGKHVYSNQ